MNNCLPPLYLLLFISLISSALGTTACMRQDAELADDTSRAEALLNGPIKGFLADEQLTPPATISKLGESLLQEKLNDMDELYFNRSRFSILADRDSPMDSCVDELFEPFKFLARGPRVVVQFDVDTSKCVDEATESQTASYKTRALMIYEVEGADFSYLHEQPISKFAEIDNFSEYLIEQSSLLNFQINTLVQSFGNYEGKAAASSSAKTSSNAAPSMDEASSVVKGSNAASFEGENGGPCLRIVHDGLVTLKAPCRKRMLEKFERDGQTTASYANVHFKNTEARLRDKHYRKGTADFVLNDWTGSITFKGPKTPPSWTASNKSSSASGTISDSVQRKIPPVEETRPSEEQAEDETDPSAGG